MSEQQDEFDRRNFMKTAAGTAAAATAFTGAASGQGTPDKRLKIGFVGTGGRGTGAAVQALSADDNVELHCVADLFQDRIDKSLAQLAKTKRFRPEPLFRPNANSWGSMATSGCSNPMLMWFF